MKPKDSTAWMMGYHISKSCSSHYKTATVFMEVWYFVLRAHCMVHTSCSVSRTFCPYLKHMRASLLYTKLHGDEVVVLIPTYCVDRYVLWQLWTQRWCVAMLLISVYASCVLWFTVYDTWHSLRGSHDELCVQLLLELAAHDATSQKTDLNTDCCKKLVTHVK